MSEILINRETEPVLVKYYISNGMWLKGSVFPVTEFSDGRFLYTSNNSSDFVNDIAKARCLFDFSFCWRGVWEGRIYFKDEEYWSEEIQEMADIWKQIEVQLKGEIKALNPNTYFED